VDELGSHVVFKIKADKIQKVYIHGIIGIVSPGNFIDAAMPEPKLGNSQMMDEGISGNGRCQIQQKFQT